MLGDMESIDQLFKGYENIPKSKKTERGELLKEMAEGTGLTIRRVAYFVTGLSVEDLYFLASDCRQAAARGIPYGAAFHAALKPR
jgi:hypothetical protein